MINPVMEITEELTAISIAKSIINHGINGFSGFPGVQKIAKIYEEDKNFTDNDSRISSLISSESSRSYIQPPQNFSLFKLFSSFFETNINSQKKIFSFIIQARMCAAIAYIYGHDINDEKIKTLILLSMLGDTAKDIMLNIGIKVEKNIFYYSEQHFTPEVINEINKQIGYTLLSMNQTREIIKNFSRLKIIKYLARHIILPWFDSYSCLVVGNNAQRIFSEINN